MTHMPTAITKLHGQVSYGPPADTPGPARQVLRLRVQDLECGLELELVERVLPLVELQQVPGGPDHLAGLMDYGGESVAVVDLGLWLGMRDVEPYRLDTPIVLCSDGQVRVGFIVSSVAKVEEIPPDTVHVGVDRRWATAAGPR